MYTPRETIGIGEDASGWDVLEGDRAQVWVRSQGAGRLGAPIPEGWSRGDTSKEEGEDHV